jgi:hypothetical protein
VTKDAKFRFLSKLEEMAEALYRLGTLYLMMPLGNGGGIISGVTAVRAKPLS